MTLKRKELPNKKKGFLKGRLKKKLSERRKKVEPLTALLPHIITVTALCAGLTAIRFALQENWESAIFVVMLAAFLDGVDGRLARLLGTSSHFGAELDSFADVINFGIAPALMMYFFSLHALGNPGWAVVLFFSICMVLRLARFNVMAHDETKLPLWGKHFSVGAPAPAAALLCLSPLIFGLAFPKIHLSPLIVALIMVCVGGLMVSRIPTMSLKKLPLTQHDTIPVVLMVVVLLGCLYSAPWVTLSITIILYVITMPWVYWKYLNFLKNEKAKAADKTNV
jgi:CDP-diacylglycerol--serine O-phosphatidyltransferase